MNDTLSWKQAARAVLHGSGALAALRLSQRSTFRVLMFHEFKESSRANLDAICAHIARHFEPVPLSMIADAIAGRAKLPPNALTVTVDDGYRHFLLSGYPSFARHHIPTTIYAVSGFSEGRLWLWTDQVAFALQNAAKNSISLPLAGERSLLLDLSSPEARARSTQELWDALKLLPNERRLQCLQNLPALCRVELPPAPPPECAPLSWEELRALAADGVEVGCHTDSHPILSRLGDRSALEREIDGAKRLMEERLRRPVVHFCYPNGRPVDIGDAAVDCVRQAGYRTSVTCTYGLNRLPVDPFRIMRLPFEPDLNLHYAKEVLVGFHLAAGGPSDAATAPAAPPPR